MKKAGLRSILVLLLVILQAGILAQSISANPIPDSLSPGEDFHKFSENMQRAIQRKDTQSVFSKVFPDLINGFAYEQGKDRFKKLWNDPFENLSYELMETLKLGAARTSNSSQVFVPWFWTTFPDTLDAFGYGYGLKNKIPVYSKASVNSTLIDYVEQEWIKVFSWFEGDTLDENSNPLWIGVVTTNKDSGYVEEKFIRSLLSYRFWFEFKNNQWMLMGWAAGD